MEMLKEFFTLNDGSTIPKIGFGTYHEQFGNNLDPIRTAIKVGYRFFDTASLYETEKYLGQAVKESGIPREEFIIETKVWYDEMGYEGTKAALDRSLRRLGMDYVDIYLIHWPRVTGAPDESWKERDLETWRAMEELVQAGKVRRLGLSNFLPHHLKNILDNCSIKPVVDQLELHPGYSQEAAVAYCQANGVVPMAWSPLGRGRENATIGNAVLVRLAEKYGKSVQQINLKFLLQKDIIVIPKATSEAHIRANLELTDFALTEEEISMLSCMPQTAWLGEHPDFYIPDKQTNPDNI